MARFGSWDDDDTDDGDDERDAYDRPRPTEFDSEAQARAAADASPALRDGAVLITWERPETASAAAHRRFAWRGSDLGMDLPPGGRIISRYRGGAWHTD